MRRAAASVFCGLFLFPAPAVAGARPNDPYFRVQWGLKAIGAEAAWTVTKGEASVVAVIDTGVDMGHPDLRGRIVQGVDLVDDDDDPSDLNGHGTLIAGIVAASTFNGVGVASVAPEADVMPVRVLAADGTGSSADVARGIRWAVAHGADVINLSLAQDGGDGAFLVPEGLLRDPRVDRAIVEAARAGRTVVVAAGNDPSGGEAETAYDAHVAGALVVGASTKDDRHAAYSDFGRGLDLVAPGGGSATDPGDDGCTEGNSIVSAWWNPAKKRSSYGGGCGTSMAVAFVSGVAALLHARGMDNVEVVERILVTADDIAARGLDDRTGRGRLNAGRALGAKPAQGARIAPGPGGSATPRGGVRAQGAGERATLGTTPPGEAPRAAGAAASTRRGWQAAVAALMLALVAMAHGARAVALFRPRR